MSKYVIVAESGADLSRDTIKRHNIYVAPMHVALGDVDYLDGIVSIEDIFAYYDKTGKVPQTGAANPYDYQQIYDKIAVRHPEAVILHLCYSAQTTASFQNAQITESKPNRVIHIDTKNVSVGQGFIVTKVAELIESSPDIAEDELVAQIETYISGAKFFFIPGNLDFLRAGGRVSNAQYIGATILGMKPLIELTDGLLISTKKYRASMKNAVLRMIDDFFSKADMDKTMTYMVNAGDLDEEIRLCVADALEEKGVKKNVWHKAGGVITSHSGSGGIGIAGIAK